MFWIIGYLCLINLIGFLLFGMDKYKAIHQKWRISEKTLLLTALLGGGLGCVLAMHLFHHKTQHKKFTMGIPLLLILDLFLFILLWNFSRHDLSYQNSPRKLVAHELSVLLPSSHTAPDDSLIYSDLFPSEHMDKTIPSEVQSIFIDFFHDFSYKIKSVKKESDKAQVTVSLTTLDGAKLAKEYTSQMLIRQIQNSASPANVQFSLEDCYLVLSSILKNDSISSKTSVYTIELQKENNIWTFSSPKELSSALTGGFSFYVSDPGLLTPSETISIYMDTLKSFDTEQLSRFLTLDAIFEGNAEYKRIISRALSKQLLTYMDYKIISEELSENGMEATVVTELTNCDCHSMMNNYQQQVMEYTKTAQALEDGISGRLNIANQLLIDSITSNTDSIVTTLPIHMKNDGTGWKLEISDEISDALLGNIGEAIEEVFQSLQ